MERKSSREGKSNAAWKAVAMTVLSSWCVLAVGLLSGLDTNAAQCSSWADMIIYDELDVNWTDRF